MLSFIRPDKPGDFDRKSDDKLEEVKKQYDKKPDKMEFAKDFWGKYKDIFMQAQHRKCGYCEMFITDYGDMEHYRPKGVVEEIAEEGAERSNLHTVKGRKFKSACKYGYWWLAYDWDNYLLSCKLCNQPWKRALFPLKNGRRANTNSDSDKYPFKYPLRSRLKDEQPLLLNPYDKVDFTDHLSFDRIGGVAAHNGSELGQGTIETVGLDRTSLVQSRNGTAADVFKKLDRIATGNLSRDAEFFLVDDLVEMGGDTRAFAGMVRIICEQSTGWTWEEFVKHRDDINPD